MLPQCFVTPLQYSFCLHYYTATQRSMLHFVTHMNCYIYLLFYYPLTLVSAVTTSTEILRYSTRLRSFHNCYASRKRNVKGRMKRTRLSLLIDRLSSTYLSIGNRYRDLPLPSKESLSSSISDISVVYEYLRFSIWED